jgi:hypothetical protein
LLSAAESVRTAWITLASNLNPPLPLRGRGAGGERVMWL